jgi:polyhydroxyalkanoate synthesis regulator protein
MTDETIIRRYIEMFQNAMRMFTPFPNMPQATGPAPAAMQRKIDSVA